MFVGHGTPRRLGLSSSLPISIPGRAAGGQRHFSRAAELLSAKNRFVFAPFGSNGKKLAIWVHYLKYMLHFAAGRAQYQVCIVASPTLTVQAPVPPAAAGPEAPTTPPV